MCCNVESTKNVTLKEIYRNLIHLMPKRKLKFSDTYLKPSWFSKMSKTRMCGGIRKCEQYSSLKNYQ